MSRVTTRTEELQGQPVRHFEAPADGTPVLYVHGVPTGGGQWRPFLERIGGIAPDLPGFGASGKRGDLPYDLPFYADWLDSFCAARGLDRVRLVAQDWGAGFALAWAQRHPARVERLVLLDAVPLLEGYRWHRIARAWRTRVLGELVMGATTRAGARLLLREATATPGPPPAWFFDEVVWPGFDAGTQRAILRLYRSAGPDVLAAAGRDLGAIGCPALVLWGAEDPYIPPRFCAAYAGALGGETEHEVLDGAGHWPWLDREDVVDRVAAFLAR